MSENKIYRFDYTRKIAVSGMLLAISVVLNFYEVNIPIMGASVFRLRWSSPFLDMAAFFFGGVYGGIVRALCDIISFLLHPTGAYLWPLTVTEFLKGFAMGYMWFKFAKTGVKWFSRVYLAVFSALCVWGAVNFALYSADVGYTRFLRGVFKVSNVETNTSYLIFSGLILGVGIVGIITYVPTIFLSLKAKRENGEYGGEFIKLFAAVAAPCLTVTTINTEIFLLFGIIPPKAFTAAWFPRFVKEFAVVMVSVYLVRIFLAAWRKIPRLSR